MNTEEKKLSEEVLNELESTEVVGGKQEELEDSQGGFQCRCQNYQCGKHFEEA